VHTAPQSTRLPKGQARKQKDTPSRQRRRLAREAAQLSRRIDQARAERREAWPAGQSEFAAERQERKLNELHGEKRGLRRDVYARAPELEGAEFRKQHPGRSR
jgi:hypothetical protein